MAKVADVFLNGTIGNVVFYRRMGTNCARLRALHVKQSAATKIRSANFGIAARAGRILRSGLMPSMPNARDQSMQNRFSGAMAKWLGVANPDELPSTDVVPHVSIFGFITGSAFRARFEAPLTVNQPEDNLVTISIEAVVPSLQISAPAVTVSVTLVLSVAGCLLKNGDATGSETHRIEIPYNNIEIPAQTLQFHIPIPAQSHRHVWTPYS